MSEHDDVSPGDIRDDGETVELLQSRRQEDVDPVSASIGRQIRAVRKMRRLTLEEVATASDLTTGYLSQIERGLALPTITALKRVADTLSTQLADFFQGEELASPYGLVRRGERSDFHHPVSGQVYQQLTKTWSGRMNAALYSLQPDERTQQRSHAGEEFAFVLVGSIEYCIGSRHYRMDEGDSLYFDCAQTHCVVNVGFIEAKWIWVSAPSL